MHALVKNDLETLSSKNLKQTASEHLYAPQQLLSILEAKILKVDQICLKLKLVSQDHLEKARSALIDSVTALCMTLNPVQSSHPPIA